MYADYAFYTGDGFYGKTIAGGDFPSYAARASDFIDYYTRGKAARVTDETILRTLAKCCCALAEKMLAVDTVKEMAAQSVRRVREGGDERPEKRSESVGSWSATFTTSAEALAAAEEAEKAANDVYAKIALRYLLNTGLLYRGGRSCTLHTP